jgi:hypothetical protein
MRDNKSQNYIYGETFSPDAPRPTEVVYEILSQHLAAGSNNPEMHAALNDVYKALGGSEQESSTALDNLEQKGAIAREDVLMLVVLLAVSRTQGPDLDFLRQTIVTGNFDPNELAAKITASGLNKNIVDFLQKITPKLKR